MVAKTFTYIMGLELSVLLPKVHREEHVSGASLFRLGLLDRDALSSYRRINDPFHRRVNHATATLLNLLNLGITIHDEMMSSHFFVL